MTNLIDIILLGIILAVSIGLHEYAHAWSAYKLGDPTPKLQGRLTPNPLAHIDLVGFLMVFLIHFGWGKPVQINPGYFKKPLRDELLSSLAGPFTNIILAFFGSIILFISIKFIFGVNPDNLAYIWESNNIVIKFWIQFMFMNIGLAVFNMLPIFPLDGYRIVKYLFPNIGFAMERNQNIMFLVFALLLFAPGFKDLISTYIMGTSGLIGNMFVFIMAGIFY